jgi:hypothetical protein
VSSYDERIYQKYQCLSLSTKKLEEWVQHGNKPFLGDRDRRVARNFHKIPRK